MVEDGDITAIITTHSTAIISALSDYPHSTVCFMKKSADQRQELQFVHVTESHRAILPIFGAHPLTNVFNQKPGLIVEGEDDERVWQQAVRSANGLLRLHPVPCSGVSNMHEFEVTVDNIISSVYDTARAFSLRDGDGIADDMTDSGAITRLRLSCRAVENLMLTNEVLQKAGVSEANFRLRVDDWIVANPGHQEQASMLAFRDSGYNRKDSDLKMIRNVLVGDVLQSPKAWEVIVGQALGAFAAISDTRLTGPGTLTDFLGPKVIDAIFNH